MTITCRTCQGTGTATRVVFAERDGRDLSYAEDETCETCGGTGTVAPDIASVDDMAAVVARARGAAA